MKLSEEVAAEGGGRWNDLWGGAATMKYGEKESEWDIKLWKRDGGREKEERRRRVMERIREADMGVKQVRAGID